MPLNNRPCALMWDLGCWCWVGGHVVRSSRAGLCLTLRDRWLNSNRHSPRPTIVGGVVKVDVWLGSATTVGSALRFRLMGPMWPWYSSVRWVLWFDCLCGIKNILKYFMFSQ